MPNLGGNIASTQSPYQKLNIGNTSQKTRKSRYQTFPLQSSFTGFLCFVPNILPRIVDCWIKTFSDKQV